MLKNKKVVSSATAENTACEDTTTKNQVNDNKKRKITQEDKVYKHLLENKKGITSIEAFSKYKITRLSAVIFNLRKDGYLIVSVRETNENTGTSYARYILKGEANGTVQTM